MDRILEYILLLVTMTFLSCKDAQYVVRQTDKNLKYSYAQNWYMKGKYLEAIPVIENIMPLFKGTDTSSNLYFMLADCYFQNKEFMVAAYHFKTFRELYPRSYKAEVATYKIAECYKNEIPRLELEQTDNEKAINYYRSFIAEYPKSPMVEQAYHEIEILQQNLENKALLAGDLYYKTKNYRAAAVTYRNVLNEYPKIKRYEELYYKIGKSHFQFAEKSIISKQPERYEKAIEECQNFINRFPNSKFTPELTGLIEIAKIKLLESSLRHANTYIIYEERPMYYSQSLELYDEFIPEIKTIPTELQNYKDKCYLGILKAHYSILELSKEGAVKNEKYKIFIDNYYQLLPKFTSSSPELIEAEELYKKVNQYYKS